MLVGEFRVNKNINDGLKKTVSDNFQVKMIPLKDIPQIDLIIM